MLSESHAPLRNNQGSDDPPSGLGHLGRLLLGLALLLIAGCSSEATTTTAATSSTLGVADTPATTVPPPLKDMTKRPQIWFGPLDPWSWEQHLPGEGPFEFYDLFTEEAPWETAAAAVQVMRLYPAWLEHYATSAQLRTVIADLQRRGIAITFESGPLTETPRCNAATVEGFSGPGPARAIAERVRDAGGTLYGMDLEHGFDAATFDDLACRMTPIEIARDALNTIEAVRAIFPEVRVGSIETANLDAEAVAAWLEAYHEATGTELDYFHLDVNYLRPDWAARAREIEDHVRSRGIEFGIIYLGAEEDSSDEAWLARAEERMVHYEVVHGGRPDHAVFQSWHEHPRRLLPDSEPGTFTNLILRYLRSRTTLQAAIERGVISGSLLDADGAPLAGANLTIQAEATTGAGLITEYTIAGTVPEGVSGADVGYRINTECGCSGTIDLMLYESRYSEQDSTVNLVPNGGFGREWESWGAWGTASYSLVASGRDGGRALSVSASPGHDAGLNSGLFPVTPGAAFEVTFTAKVSPGSEGSGYFHIIFHDAAGERQRLTIPLQPGRLDLGGVTTGPDGRFETSVDELTDMGFRVGFGGDDDNWPAVAWTG
jgi:hypothetical protein